MSSQIEDELRATFEAASDFVQPRSGLADRVRARSRRHRRRRLAVGLSASTACVLLAAGSGYIAGHGHSPTTTTIGQHASKVLITFPRGYQPRQVLASGSYLYASLQHCQQCSIADAGLQYGRYTVAAYDRATGRLVRQLKLGADRLPQLAVGPDGLVWLSLQPFPGAGPASTWLLSPDLRPYSDGPGSPYGFVLPFSRNTALAADSHGVLELRMPAPGKAGRGTWHSLAHTGLGSNPTGELPVGSLGGRFVVALAYDRSGTLYYYLEIAGHPTIRYGGSSFGNSNITGYQAAIASGSVWLAKATGSPVVRLDGQLRVTTPESIRANRLLRNAVDVWSDDGTVWVYSRASQRSLVCFRAGMQVGPVTPTAVHGVVDFLAANGRTVYLTQTPRRGRRWSVISYPVPAACR